MSLEHIILITIFDFIINARTVVWNAIFSIIGNTESEFAFNTEELLLIKVPFKSSAIIRNFFFFEVWILNTFVAIRWVDWPSKITSGAFVLPRTLTIIFLSFNSDFASCYWIWWRNCIYTISNSTLGIIFERSCDYSVTTIAFGTVCWIESPLTITLKIL